MRTLLIICIIMMASFAFAADLPITTKTLDEMQIASLRYQGQYEEVGKYMEELMTAVGDKDYGPYFAIYYDSPDKPVHDVEVCVPVSAKVEKGKVKTRTLAGGIYARTLHLGDYKTIGDTWMRLSSFVMMNNLYVDGPSMEVYLGWDPHNVANYVTEVMMPVKSPVEPLLAQAGPSNRIVHFEIPADDPERAVAFYSKAFGWKIQKWENVEYWLCMTGTGPGIDGAIYKRGDSGMTGLVNSMQVANLDAAVKAVEANGGKITVPKAAIPGVGWLVYATDTEGNLFGMMQSDPTAK